MLFIVKSFVFLALAVLLPFTDVWAGQLRTGDEIAGEVFVSWKAVVDKVSTGENEQTRVKARIEFAGQTIGGHRIRGTGKMRFSGPNHATFSAGDQLRGDSVLLKYWGSVTNLFGGDLIMVTGVGLFHFARMDRAQFSPVVIELKAAMDLEQK